ncbi:MAG: hypothetical protein HND43_08020 [Armatimonadetes bacterium]|nr:MAG: hypothetical protein EDM74_06220 [Armatimonadota bacterium]KXK10948.1 MAG: hypothetical protein UZ18_ATM001002387 [Armatimonadetes bacterium OLB18]MBV6491386.1 hypothetical protein [Fimbriimonadaceae bacterium]QOJ11680.1 MAG: hypothetical protein HRU74_06275 [Chthonomonadaceae bacterium]MBL1152661.1 hypothetical protein [Armatimonadota bacterium]
MSKLSPVTILSFGIAIAIVALSYGYFYEWSPNMLAKSYWDAHKEKVDAEANKLSRAQKRKEDAIQMVQDKADQWKAVVARHTPPPSVSQGGINLAVNAWQLTVDTYAFRNSVQRQLNAQIKRGGVTVVAGPTVPDPGPQASSLVANYFNMPPFQYPVVIYDFGSVTVRGNYSQIMNHVRSWSSMPNFLAVADGLQLTGTSPNLTATYSLTVVGYIRAKETFPPVPEGASAGGGPGAPGGVGGPPSGGSRQGPMQGF